MGTTSVYMRPRHATEHGGVLVFLPGGTAMLDLTLSLFGRYITIHAGRVADAVWDDEPEAEPTYDLEPVPETKPEVICFDFDESWYE